MFYKDSYSHVEALLFASGEPITSEKISKILDIPIEHIEDILFDLKEELNKPIHGITIRQVANGYQLCTKKELAKTINKLSIVRESKIAPTSMETLAIIAFKQPITKQEIEFIRGIKSDRVINNLIELKMVKEAGRKEAVGRPILYATTNEFLTSFGMNSLLDLPKLPTDIFQDKLDKQIDEEEVDE